MRANESQEEICHATVPWKTTDFSDKQDAADDIRGAKIYGPSDEKLGEIDDVIFDQASGAITYVLVDTGGWLSSRKFLVPPGTIRPSLQDRDDYLIDLTKEQIESLAPYDSAALSSEEKWADYRESRCFGGGLDSLRNFLSRPGITSSSSLEL
ncbi:MAG TPA: PRC-barrel domain-containing protein [Terriglobales bacterium]|nr:PRC-barrel domain-containing protein [Terriglobales bacterium]